MDWIAGNIYWTDPRLHVIEVSRLNGTHRKVLVYTGTDKPIFIAVDPIHGLMFWNEGGDVKRIRKAALSGTNKQTVVNETLSNINDITLDYDVRVIHNRDNRVSNC